VSAGGLVFSSLLLVLVYVSFCLVLGAVTSKFLLSRSDGVEGFGYVGAVCLSFVLGQSLYGVVWQSLSVFSEFNRFTIILTFLMAAGLGVFWADCRQFLSDCRSLFSVVMTTRLSWIEALLAMPVVLILALLAILAFYPEGIDALAFYMAQPKLVAATGSFTLLPGYEYFAHIGLGAEMSYAAMMALSPGETGHFAARMIVWFTLVALIGVTWELGRSVGVKRVGGLILISLILTSTAISNIAYDGKTDLFAASWAMGAIFVLVIGSPNYQKSNVFVSGMLGGLAIGAKLSFFVIVPPIMLGVVLWGATKRLRGNLSFARLIRLSLSQCMILFCGGALGLLPLVLKNTMVFGEPFAPLYFFSAPNYNLIDQVWYSDEITSWIVSTYPLAVVFGKYPMQHGNISVLLLALAPVFLYFIARRENLSGFSIVLFCLGILAVVLWVAARPSILAPRYILPAFLVLFPAIASCVERALVRKEFGGARYVIGGAIILSLVFTAVRLLPAVKPSYANLLQSADKTWTDPVWSMPKTISDEAPPGTRVFNAMYSRFPLRADLIQCLVSVDDMKRVYKINSTERMWESMYKLGAKFMVIYTVTHEPFFSAPLDVDISPDWLTVTEEDFGVGNYKLYRLYPTKDAPSVKQTCEEVEPGLWK
tara:strand:+ start:4275 stop:6227 length:1953 start_codon:yes stop_codon:yes gene_type:complete